MYILLESAHADEPIDTARIYSIDCMGTAETEADAIAWRNKNIDYRAYKYLPKIMIAAPFKNE